MNERVIEIYKALYSNLECTKEKLAKYLNVSSIKTVESNIKDIEEIVYDLKIRKYRFTNLLPEYIPNETFYNIMKDSIVNKLLQHDFNLLTSAKTNTMIKTAELSNLSRKIIMIKNAINNNAVLKVYYLKNDGKTEIKYVQPNTIFTNGFTYYSFITYDKKNNDNIGEERTFAFNGIKKIEVEEYTSNGPFLKELKGNAFGTFKKDKFVILHLNQNAAHFFKRENLLNNDAFELIDEELLGNSITVKMFYNSYFEIVKIVQQWMPNIKIQNNLELKEKVYLDIKQNLEKLRED
ncbi:WYL domain-containing protein [Campylobacterota bacterium DY0563]